MLQVLAQHSEVPVINALSSDWHPTQILADLLTMHEDPYFQDPSSATHSPHTNVPSLTPLRPLTITWLGDSSNVLHDMLVTFPRLGHKMRVATPPNPKYRCPDPIWNRVQGLGCDKGITWTDDPREAVHGADLVITDTWYTLLSCALFVVDLQNQDLNGTRSRKSSAIKGLPGLSGHREALRRRRRKEGLEVYALLASQAGRSRR